jgi:hypothetical protein
VFRERYHSFVAYLGVAAAAIAELGERRFAAQYAAGASLSAEEAFGLAWAADPVLPARASGGGGVPALLVRGRNHESHAKAAVDRL